MGPHIHVTPAEIEASVGTDGRTGGELSPSPRPRPSEPEIPRNSQILEPHGSSQQGRLLGVILMVLLQRNARYGNPDSCPSDLRVCTPGLGKGTRVPP